VMPATLSKQDEIHSLWSKLVKYDPERIARLVDHVFSKYNQPFKLLSHDDVKHEVEIELKDGKQIKLKI
jgi:hypothetical protein